MAQCWCGTCARLRAKMARWSGEAKQHAAKAARAADEVAGASAIAYAQVVNEREPLLDRAARTEEA